jgi:hypothetical protein
MGNEISIPYNFIPRSYQMEVLKRKERFIVLIWHRRAGKSCFALNKLIIEAFKQVGVYWYIAPYANQVKRIIFEDPEMLNKYIPPGCKINHTELKIELPNGSIIRFIGADNPENLRGSGLRGLVIDEFDDIDISIWTTILQPMLSLTRGWAMFIGTVKGYLNLYNFYKRATETKDKDWWCGNILDAETSGILPQEELDRLKKDVLNGELPQVVYDQEYRSQFNATGSGLFRRIDNNLWDGDLVIQDGRQYQIGIDLAKLNDYTVIIPVDLHTWKVGIPDRFTQLDYNLIESRIESNWRKYNKAHLRVEANSIGEPVCDHLQKRGIVVERFTTTEKLKEAMLKNLSILIETDSIKLPNYEPLIKELKAMRYERDEKTKKIKLVSTTEHDDCVMALSFACWNLSKVPLVKEESYDVKEFKKYKKLMYGSNGGRVIDNI